MACVVSIDCDNSSRIPPERIEVDRVQPLDKAVQWDYQRSRESSPTESWGEDDELGCFVEWQDAALLP